MSFPGGGIFLTIAPQAYDSKSFFPDNNQFFAADLRRFHPRASPMPHLSTRHVSKPVSDPSWNWTLAIARNLTASADRIAQSLCSRGRASIRAADRVACRRPPACRRALHPSGPPNGAQAGLNSSSPRGDLVVTLSPADSGPKSPDSAPLGSQPREPESFSTAGLQEPRISPAITPKVWAVLGFQAGGPRKAPAAPLLPVSTPQTFRPLSGKAGSPVEPADPLQP